MNGIAWNEYILQNPNQIHKVLIKDHLNKEHIFEVKGKLFHNDSNLVEEIFVFNDITLLELERENIAQKDKILFEQSKMASMGEMIGNIAHQWRQPLSVISTTATGALIKNEMGLLDKEELNKSFNSINDSAQFLSKTIDDFRNFLKPHKNKEQYKIINTIQQTINLVGASLKNHDIKLITNLKDDIIINGYSNEIIQALINIINNAKDALKNIEDNKFIFIDSYKDRYNYIITIQDNGGGIPEKIINRIFEPYFTTKHKFQGTGIGLYMTYQILTVHTPGDIKVHNVTFKYEGKEYKGAKFFIKIPIEQ
jgi:signal transduction histidine kinase